MSTPRDPGYADRVRRLFAAQGMMATLGASLCDIAPGAVSVRAPITRAVSQQHGFGHAGLAWTLGDTAAGFAAQSLMAATDGVLTVEMKINLLAPARGTALIARGRVERAGRRLSVVRADVVAVDAEGGETAVAILLGTMMCMEGMG